jgi:phage FluMu gp28-like protein
MFFFNAANASDIGLGTVKGIKIYDMSADKLTKIHLSDDATHKALSGCNGVGVISHTRDPEIRKEILSVAMAAYMSGKKVRIYSSSGTCEVDFIALQETYF